MKAGLLKLARREGRAGAIRAWALPGLPHPVRIMPAGESSWPGAPAASFPIRDPGDPGGWIRYGARLDWHCGPAFRAIRGSIAEAVAAVAQAGGPDPWAGTMAEQAARAIWAEIESKGIPE